VTAISASAALIAALAVPAAAAPAKNPAPGSRSAAIRDLQTKRNEVRSNKAKTAQQVDTITATDAEVTTALRTLSENIAGQSAQLEDARQAVTQAEADAATALAAESQAQTDLNDLRTDLKKDALTAYVSSPPDMDFAFLSAASLADDANRRTFLSVRASKNLDSVERYRTVQEQLALARSNATAAEQRAEQHRSEVTNRLTDLEQAQEAQEAFAEQLDERLDRALSEAASLEQLDGALASDISRQQTVLANELAAQRAAADRLARSRRGSGSTARPPVGSSRPIPTIATSGNIVSVGGIRVDASIADNLQRLLADAAAAGINFGGGGFRDPAGQIAVRRSNCGSSDYMIYQAPASACRPPTARPGQSQHEVGLAVDFTEGGRTLNRSSGGFAWLRANGGSYGFYNLPAEPWHWSTTGR